MSVSALDMAAGYSTLANEGVQRDPYMVERIEDNEGRVVYQHDVVDNQALDRGAALRTVDILKGVIRQGTATRAKISVILASAGARSWFFPPRRTRTSSKSRSNCSSRSSICWNSSWKSRSRSSSRSCWRSCNCIIIK